MKYIVLSAIALVVATFGPSEVGALAAYAVRGPIVVSPPIIVAPPPGTQRPIHFHPIGPTPAPINPGGPNRPYPPQSPSS